MQSGATVQEGKGKVRSGSELLDVFEVSFIKCITDLVCIVGMECVMQRNLAFSLF